MLKDFEIIFFSFRFCTSSTKTNVISFERAYLIVILYFRYWLFFFSFCLFSGLFRHFLLHKFIYFILKSTSQMHAYNKVRLWKKTILRLLHQIRFFLSVSIFYFSISYCHVCKENWRAILILLYNNTGAYFFVCLFVKQTNKQINGSVLLRE